MTMFLQWQGTILVFQMLLWHFTLFFFSWQHTSLLTNIPLTQNDWLKKEEKKNIRKAEMMKDVAGVVSCGRMHDISLPFNQAGEADVLGKRFWGELKCIHWP